MNRTEILNVLASKYRYKRYLEIGVRSGINLRGIVCPYRVGVDPDPEAFGVSYRMTSDEFFQTNSQVFDLIFIDGCHTDKQVTKDVMNALLALNDGGTIVMHDCNPPDEWSQRPEEEFTPPERWNGTAWKSYVKLRTRDDLSMCVVDCDEGVGIVRKGSQKPIELPAVLAYADLDKNRQEWLNLKSPTEWLEEIADD